MGTVGVTAACSGHGICRTMREAGMSHNGVSLVKPYVYYDQWDADKIQGCLAMLDGKAMIVAFVHVPKAVIPIVLTENMLKMRYIRSNVKLIMAALLWGCSGWSQPPYLTTQTQNM